MTDYMDVTTNAAIIPTIIAAQALGALKSNMTLAATVNRDYDNEVASYGNVIKIPVRAALTVNDKAAGSDVTVQDPTTTALTVTLNKHKEVTFGEEDVATMFSRPDSLAGYAEDAAIAILEQIETDLAGLYSGFSQTINAAAGLSDANFREAQRLLNAAKAPQGMRYAHLHEDAYAELMALDKVVNSDYQGPEGYTALQNGVAGKLYGFNVLLNQNIVVSTTCKNIFAHRDAMVLATRPMRTTPRRNVEQVVMSEGGIGLRVTMSYNANALAEQVTIDVLYGVAEMRDTFGIAVSTTEV